MSEGSIDAYWCLRIPTGVCGYLLESVDAYWCLTVPTVI